MCCCSHVWHFLISVLALLESFLGTTAELFLLQEKILAFAAMFTESFLSMKALPEENSNRRRLLRRGSGFSDQSASLPPPANSCSRSKIFFFFFFTAPAPNPQIFDVANVEISADTKSLIRARLYPEIL
jgi:hypothetical protein